MEEIRITANAKLQEILGQDYNEQMQNVINHAINFLQPDKVKELINGISCLGPAVYINHGITDTDKINRIKQKIKVALPDISGGAIKRRTQATTVKHRKSSRRQLPLRRRRGRRSLKRKHSRRR